MPTGLKLRVGWDELKEHFEDRQKHHEARASYYTGQLAAMKEAGVEDRGIGDRDVPDSSSFMSRVNPYDTARNAVRSHLQSAAKYAFQAGHLMEEDYLLTEQEFHAYDPQTLFSNYYASNGGAAPPALSSDDED